MPRHRREIPWIDTIEGAYYVHWHDAKARRVKRRSLRTRDPGEAQARYAVLLAEGQAIFGAAETKAADVLTCAAILDDYFREHVEPKVVDKGRAQVSRDHLQAHFGSVPVSGICQTIVSQYLAKRAAGEIGRQSKPSTQRLELTTLMAALKHAVRNKRLEPGDVPYIDLPAQSEPRCRWLTRPELEALLTEARKDVIRDAEGRYLLTDTSRLSRLFRFCAIAYETASRKSAVLSLTWFQVDLERRRITLDKPGTVKTKKRRPPVPISDWLYQVLRQAHAERQSEYVLDHPGAIYTAFFSAVARAGLTDYVDDSNYGKVIPHTLRHTKATHLLQDGVSPFAVAGLLGDTVDTVLQVYGHHCPDYLEGALKGQTAPLKL